MVDAVARKRTDKNEGLETYVKCNGGYYNYQHPVMRAKGIKAESFGRDKKAANEFAREANLYFGQNNRFTALISRTVKEHTLADVVDRFLSSYHLLSRFNNQQEELDYIAKTGKRPQDTWSYGHTRNLRLSLKKIKKAEGSKIFSALKVPDWEQMLYGNFHGNGIRKSRDFAVELYKFAIGKGLTTDLNNYPEKVLIERPEKRKRPRIADYDEYLEKRAQCPEWLQDAMDIALLTPFGRSEVVRLKREHVVKSDGEVLLKLFRQKTGVWFEVECSPWLLRVVQRCQTRSLALGCPYLICTPQQDKGGGRQYRNYIKSHRCQVLPAYLTNKFKKYTGGQFHEIRSLGGRLLESQGWSKEQVQAYYAHGRLSTTEIYLQDDKPKSVRVASGLIEISTK